MRHRDARRKRALSAAVGQKPGNGFHLRVPDLARGFSLRQGGHTAQLLRLYFTARPLRRNSGHRLESHRTRQDERHRKTARAVWRGGQEPRRRAVSKPVQRLGQRQAAGYPHAAVRAAPARAGAFRGQRMLLHLGPPPALARRNLVHTRLGLCPEQHDDGILRAAAVRRAEFLHRPRLAGMVHLRAGRALSKPRPHADALKRGVRGDHRSPELRFRLLRHARHPAE